MPNSNTVMTLKKKRRACSNPACANRASAPDLNALVRYFASLRERGVIDNQQYYELTRLVASKVIEREVECLVADKIDQVIFQKFSSLKLLEASAWT
jgi:dUTPase